MKDTRLGGGHHTCGKCGAIVFGSALHHCDLNRLIIKDKSRDMKDTPLLKLLDEIEGYRPIAGTDPFPYIIAKLQSLLTYERECLEGAFTEGEAVGLNHSTDTAHDYFTQTFKTNPQGGGVL